MTTPRERDESLDRWLRSMQVRESAPTAACLDAATAAAWADGGLSEAERDQAQAHVADCARCQSLVATLAVTDAVPAGAAPESESSWRRWFGWVVPLTAAATALIAVTVWLRAPEPSDRPATMSAARQESETRQTLPEESAKSAADSLAAPGTAPTDGRPAAPSPQAVEAEPPAVSAPPASPPPRAEAARAPARADANQAPQQQGFGAADKSTAALTAEAASAAERPSAAPENGARLRDAAAPAVDIAAPDGSTRWRVAGADVQRSLDGGGTWSPTPTGSTAPLIAGSAPSAGVCWLVGRGGTVLRTTDRTTWTAVAFPEPVDLVAVRALDARSATVTTADGRVFATADGATWSLVPAP